MNGKNRRLEARFAPETRFEVRPGRSAGLETLKNELIEARAAEEAGEGLSVLLEGAAREAIAVASLTAYPLLFFPLLFEEKIETALARASRRAGIEAESPDMARV